MPLIDVLASHISRAADQFVNMIDREGFLEASLESKLMRIVVSVGAVWASIAALKFGIPLAISALTGAPFLLTAAVVSIVLGCTCLPIIGFLFLIPIALWSLPVVIQGAGAALTIAIGLGGLALAGKALSII